LDLFPLAKAKPLSGVLQHPGNDCHRLRYCPLHPDGLPSTAANCFFKKLSSFRFLHNSVFLFLTEISFELMASLSRRSCRALRARQEKRKILTPEPQRTLSAADREHPLTDYPFF